jgi:hypothetical protein
MGEIENRTTDGAPDDGEGSHGSRHESDQPTVPLNAALVGPGPASKALQDAKGALCLLWYQR